MSQDVAILGKGCTLSFKSINIKGIRTIAITPPGSGEPEKVDVTSHSSASTLREKIDGFVDLVAGTVSFDAVWDITQAGHAAIKTAYATGASETCILVVKGKTANATGTFKAYVSKLEIQGPYDGAVTADVTLTVDEDGIVWT